MDKVLLEKLKTLKILYIEDDERIRKKLSDSLRYYAQEVFEAQNGVDGLKIYNEKHPDIIFTDIIMPKMDGIELVKSIRKTKSKIPIVIVSAHTEIQYLLDAVELHLEQYIIKPINFLDLQLTLSKCIESIQENKAIRKRFSNNCEYDFNNRIMYVSNIEIKLGKKEILLIEFLIQNSHRIVTYNELKMHIWEDDFVSDSALKSLVKNVRHKLSKNFIQNLSGIGYKIIN